MSSSLVLGTADAAEFFSAAFFNTFDATRVVHIRRPARIGQVVAGAVWLRIDTIEQGLRDLCGVESQGEGYRLAYRIAADNLRAGLSVVADSCNPWDSTRREWEAVARENNAVAVNIEVVCSDREEHRLRAETRASDIAGLKLPTWPETEAREYHPWTGDHITIDTAGKSAEESFGELKRILAIMKIEHIALWAEDPDVVSGFYVGYFGAEVSAKYHNPRRNFTSCFLSFEGGGSRIEVMHIPDMEAPASRGNLAGLAHIAVSAGSREAVDAITERLRGDGVTIVGEPRTTGDGYYESVVLDPEGNIVEIVA